MEESITPRDLLETVKQIKLHGPTRILISPEPHAVPVARARMLGADEPDIVFIRGDKWSLGAPWNLAEAAEATWPAQWSAVMILGNNTLMLYEDFQKRGAQPA